MTNYVKYYFKIYGKDQFGDEHLVGVCSGTPKDLTPPRSPYLISVLHTEPEKALVSWEIEETEPLKGFRIGRSDKDNEAFHQIHDDIIPPDWRSFTDNYFIKDTNNYYIIEAIDTAGNISKSNIAFLSIIDSVPPAIPIAINGVMDSLGIVTLEMESQTERDFMGYRVYKANAEDHEFSVVQETYNDTIVSIARKPIIIDTSTLESLTPYVYYHVTALDYHYNESKFSEMIKVPRPDKYPPVPPLISDYEITDDGIRFTFIASTSVDVAMNTLYVNDPSSEEWQAIHTFNSDTSYLYVPEENINGMVEYAANAEDLSGLVSDYGNVLKIRSVVKPKALQLDLTCTYYSQAELCLLEWQVLDTDAATDLYHSVSFANDIEKKSLGRSRYSDGSLFLASTVPSKIAITSRSQVKEYLPYIAEGCSVSSEDISKNELQLKLTRYE